MSDPKKGLNPSCGGDMVKPGLGAVEATDPNGHERNKTLAAIELPAIKVRGCSQNVEDSLFIPGDKKKPFIPVSALGFLGKVPSKLSRYYCKYCGKLFNKNCDLARHKRIHTGERPYTCQLCVMAFARKDVMHLHMRKHHMVDMTGPEKYTCLKCQACFVGTDDLKSHVLSHQESGEDRPSGSDPPGRGGARKEKKARGQPKVSSMSKSALFDRSQEVEGPNVKVCNTGNSRPERRNSVTTDSASRPAEPSAQLPRAEVKEPKASSSSSRYSVYSCKHCLKRFHKYCTLLRHQRVSHKEKGGYDTDLSKSPCSESVEENTADNAETITADTAECQKHSNSSREGVKQKEAADAELENTAVVSFDSIDFAEHPRPSSSVSSQSIDWYAHSPSLVNRTFLQQEQNMNSFPCDCNFCRSCESNPYLVNGPAAAQHLCSPRTPNLCSPVSNRFHHMHAFCGRSANFISSSRLAQIYDSNGCVVSSPLVSPCRTFENVYMHHSGMSNPCVNFNPCHNGHVYCSNEVCCHGPLAKYPKYEVIPAPAAVQNPLCNNVLSCETFRQDVLLGREPICSSRGCRCMTQIPVKREIVEDPDVLSPHVRGAGLVGGTPTMTSPVIVIKEEAKMARDCRQYRPLENHWTDMHNCAIRNSATPCLGYVTAENRRGGDFGHNGGYVAIRPNSGSDVYTHNPMERDHEINNIYLPSAPSPKEEQVSPSNYATPSVRRSAFSAYNRDRNSTADKEFSRADELPSDCRIHPTTSVRGVQPLGKLFDSGDNGADSVRGTSYPNAAPRYDLSPEDMDEFVASSITTVVKDNNQKVYQCNICKKCLSQKGDLKRHLKIHLGQKDFICLFCSRGFIKNSDLQRHIRTRHTREKPYECSQCLRKYARTDQLLDHMRMHLGDKRFECEMCHEKFLRRYELQKHVREHYQSNKKGDPKFKTEPPEMVDDDEELDVVKIEVDYSSDEDAVPDGEVEHESVSMVTSDKGSELAVIPEMVNVVDELEITAVESCPSRSSPCPEKGCTLSPVGIYGQSIINHYYPPAKTDGHPCLFPKKDYPFECSPVVKTDYTVQSSHFKKVDNPVQSNRVLKTPNPAQSNPVVKTDNPVGSNPVVNTDNSVRSSPVVNTDYPAQSNPVVKTDNPVGSNPVVKADNPVQSNPVVASDNPVGSNPVVNTDNSVRSSPVVNTDYPVQSNPVVKTDNLVRSCPVLKIDNLVRSSPDANTAYPVQPNTVKADNLDHCCPTLKIDFPHQTSCVVKTDYPVQPSIVKADYPYRSPTVVNTNYPDQPSPVSKANNLCRSPLLVMAYSSDHGCPTHSSVVKTGYPYHSPPVVKTDCPNPPSPVVKTNDSYRSSPVLKIDHPGHPCPGKTDNVVVLPETFARLDSVGTEIVKSDANGPNAKEWTDEQGRKQFTCSIKEEGSVKKNQKIPTAKKPCRSKSGQNVCQTCCRTFSQRGDLKRHMKIHSGQRDFVCTYCPKAFIKRSDLKRHLLVHTQEKPYACEFCDTRYSRKDQLQTHINRRCSKRKGFEPKQTPNSTSQKPSNSPTTRDTPAGSVETSSTTLQTSSKETFANSQNVCKEKTPMEIFSMKSTCNSVSPVRVSNENPVQARQSSDQMCIETGQRIVDNEPAEKLGPGTSMPNASFVECTNHITLNEETKRDHDNASDSKVLQSVVVESNRQSTADSKQVGETVLRNLHQFPCKHCEKRFLTKTKLQIHLMTHTHITDNEEPLERYQCTECSLRFADKDLLDNHTVVVHRVMKPYVCGYCSETFVSGGELEVHIAEHRSGLHNAANSVCSKN